MSEFSEYVGWVDDEWNTVLDPDQPIVRCRNCSYYEDTGNCTLHHLADGCLGEVVPDGFCAWGEKRTEVGS